METSKLRAEEYQAILLRTEEYASHDVFWKCHQGVVIQSWACLLIGIHTFCVNKGRP